MHMTRRSLPAVSRITFNQPKFIASLELVGFADCEAPLGKSTRLSGDSERFLEREPDRERREGMGNRGQQTEDALSRRRRNAPYLETSSRQRDTLSTMEMNHSR